MEERFQTWLGWVRDAEPVPEDERPALAARDRFLREHIYRLDPMNALAEKFLEPGMADTLIDARLGAEQIREATGGAGAMKVTVIGSGLVGAEVGRRLRADGHHVVGTTTTPEKVATLGEAFDEVLVLRGSDAEAVRAAVDGADAVVVTAGPAAARAMSVADRAATYRDVLVGTAESVVAAGGNAQLVMLSSLSVYGDAADALDEVDEDAPTSSSDDPSPRNFLAAESTYRNGAPDRTCIFRCADIYGAGDPPIEVKVRMAHEVLGGSVPFTGDALFYRVDVADVVDAILFALDRRLVGTYNLTHAEVPPSNREVFDAVGANQGFEPLGFRDELLAPARPISVDRLAAAGFVTSHSVVSTVPPHN